MFISMKQQDSHIQTEYKGKDNIRYKMNKTTTMMTSNLSKAHVTRNSSGPATLAISVQHAIK